MLRAAISVLLVVACDGSAGTRPHIDAGPLPTHDDPPVPCEPQPVQPTQRPTCGASTNTLAVVLAREGASVATSRADGTIIAEATADVHGCAAVASELDALINIAIFEPPLAYVFTVQAPTSGQLVLDYPSPKVQVPMRRCEGLSIVIDPASLPAGTEGVALDIGVRDDECLSTTNSLSFPLAIPRACLGSDSDLDLQVLALRTMLIGHNSVLMPFSFSAGRATAVDDVVTFTPTTWGAISSQCTLELDPAVPPLQPPKCSYISDDARFSTAAPGQVVDATRLAIHESGRFSYFTKPGLANSFPVVADDLLPAISNGTVISDLAAMRLHWPSELASADLVHVTAEWERDNSYVSWHVMLPPTATDALFPRFSDSRLRPPNPATNLYPIRDARLYVDSDALADYTAFLADGVHVEYASAVTPGIWPLVDVNVSRVRTTVALNGY